MSYIFIITENISANNTFLINEVRDALRSLNANYWLHYFPHEGGSNVYMHGYISFSDYDEVHAIHAKITNTMPCEYNTVTSW